ncbi:MAG: FAD-binding oxidoreductase [Candidatus Korarchaeota archaeon]|nr:FAD-binding oxidoreductase [Candidatus Korarchaeota archaeon]
MDADVLVVGAGILGLATAYHILEKNPNTNILIVDRMGDVGQGATAKSAAGFRAGLFTSSVNRLLSDTSVDFYLHVQKEEGHDLGMELVGYLILRSKEQFEEIADVAHALEKKGTLRIYSKDELKKLIDMNFDFDGDEEAEILGVKNIDYGLFGAKCGYIDADKLAFYYRDRIREKGGNFQFNTKVEKLIVEPEMKLGIPREPRAWQKVRFTGVETNKGTITAKHLVVAAGGWTHELLDPLGIDCISKPKKRQIFTFRPRTEAQKALLNTKGFNEEGILPFTFLPTGHYIRADRRDGTFWFGFSDEIRPFSTDEEPEESHYYDNIYPIVVKYFPQLEGARVDNMWAGLYMINSVDHNPVVFKRANMVVVTGASGSGILKGDAIGRIAAALVYNETHADLFGGEKIPTNTLEVEGRALETESFVF